MQEPRPDSSSSPTIPNVDSASASAQSAERLRYIEHAGKRILLVDLTGCSPQQLVKCIDAVPQHITKQPEHSLLVLGDFTGTEFTKEVIEHLKIAAVFDRSHIMKAAWVLTENLHTVLMESIRAFSQRDIAVFPTREEALDYLVS
jgi:hypothetical protein